MSFHIPEEKINQILHTADIGEVVSQYVQLKKAGKDSAGLCPFHSEKTPSFTVSHGKQIFYCFGCGMGGNVYRFLMEYNGMTFVEAVRFLAGKYNIDIPEKSLSHEEETRISQRERLLSLNRQAADFFAANLNNSQVGRIASAYLEKRGISQNAIKSFGLGYAPDKWDRLLKYFSSKKVDPGQLEAAGLIISRKDSSGYYDRFRNRIIFPIIDAQMRVIGFGGRVMDDSLPKYLNTPETLLYHKSQSLYGMDIAKRKCRETRTVHVVEGYMDVIKLSQHGVENAVATLGTALTSDHVRLLNNFADRLVLVYDSDPAGIKAASRSADILAQASDARILATLPAGYDPDDYVSKFGPESFLDLAEKAPGIVSFMMDQAVAHHGLSVKGRVRIISEMKNVLSSIQDRIERGLYIKELAERIKVDEKAVLEVVYRKETEKRRSPDYGKSTFQPQIPAQLPTPIRDVVPQSGRINNSLSVGAGVSPFEDRHRMEKDIIAMMLQRPDIIPEIDRRNILALFINADLKAIGQSLVGHPDAPASDLFSDDGPKERVVAELVIMDYQWKEDGYMGLISQFESSHRRHENLRLQERIEAAENENNQQLLLELLKEKQIQASQGYA
ncbi:DNA primase [Desulfobacterales bacterium HSG16]|nr:DNA primase [Desulfobacterales bacterium HSG16]